jgi:hypothetical protein
MAKKRQRRSGRRFIQLWTNVKRSAAYHSLSLGARCALLELLDKYNGCNNGMIAMGARELGERLDCSKSRAGVFLCELDDAGIAQPMTVGAWRGKRASEWRLMFYRCDKTGDLPVRDWPSLSPTGRTQRGNSSMNAFRLSPTGRTHIHMYQKESAT